MNEVIFIVEEREDGGFRAKGLDISIYTEAGTMEALRLAVREAVNCHFDETMERTGIIRLHMVKEELLAA